MTITLNGTTGITTPAETATTSVTTPLLTSPAATALTIQSAGTTAMTVDTSQNVGIGTTSPSAKLQVAGFTLVGPMDTTTTYQGLTLRNGKDSSVVETTSFVDAQNNLTIADSNIFFTHQTDGGSFMGFATTPAGSRSTDRRAERMRIDSSGNLLVGTTSTTTVNGGLVFIPNAAQGSGSCGYGRIGHSTGVTSGAGYFDFLYNNSIIGSIQQNGTTAVSFNTSSDYRLKENVVSMTTGLATVKALKPVTYNWKSDKSAGEGFIAHELQAVIPHAVTGEKDAVNEDGSIKPQGVDYSKIVVHLVAAIQELEARLAAVEAK
jgi:Chaperone of endosialidase